MPQPKRLPVGLSMASRARGCFWQDGNPFLLSNLYQELLSSPADGSSTAVGTIQGEITAASLFLFDNYEKPSLKIAEFSLTEEAFLLQTPELLERV